MAPRQSAELIQCDVALVGAGIMSATMAWLLHYLDPSLKLVVLERAPRAAEESSNPWNNAGTGHAALCELNYTVEQPDGTVDISKAIKINEQFQISRQLWAYLVEQGVITDPKSFLNITPHMTFVRGADNVSFLQRRFEALKVNPLFASMEFSADPAKIAQWAPLLIDGRTGDEPIATTFDAEGTDVNFGELTKLLLAPIQADGALVEYGREVTSLTKLADGSWSLRAKHAHGGPDQLIKATRVFIGAGGYALSLLQKAHLPEITGYGLFPISGQFLVTNKPDIVARHNTKVYGKASVGAPPMSVPHLDARVIDGEHWVLFGPFAGQSPKFLKEGSLLDLPKSLRPANLKSMLAVAKDNLDLAKYLVGQILLPPKRKGEELSAFMPTANLGDWTMWQAGQRAQIIKPSKEKGGTLEFGTEAIVSSDGSMQAVLGASPGASTAVTIMLDILARAWADRMDEWGPKLKVAIPTYGQSLAPDPELAKQTISRTAEILQINGPTW